MPHRPTMVSLLLVPLLVVACDDVSGPEAVAVLEAIGPTQQSVVVGTTLSEPLAIRALAITGDPVPGVTVIWEATHGELSATRTTTDDLGRASVSFTVGETAEQQRVTATVGDNVLVFLLDARSGPLARVTAEADSVVLSQVGDTATLEAVAEDEFGNLIQTLPLSFSSLDTSVATAEAVEDRTARVEAVGVGRTEVVIRASSVADTVPVIVGGGP